VLVVEGYFDALRVMASGIEEVVAPLGTALTEAQVGLLRKYTRNVFLLYDSDAAGLKATFRAGDELLRQGFSVRVVTLPPGEDPDSYAKEHGSAGLESQLSSAIDVFERKIQILDRAGWFGELQKKRRALDRLLPTIRATSDEIMRDLYVGRASEVTGVGREILARELAQGGTAATSRVVVTEMRPSEALPPQRPAIRGRGDRREPNRDRGTSAERELVWAMLQQRSRVESIAERIGPDSFRHPRYRAIFLALLDAGEEAPFADLANSLDPESLEDAQDLLSEGEESKDAQRTIDDSITKLHVRDMEDRLAEIERLLPLGNADEIAQLQDEKQKLVVQMRASGKMSFKAFRRGKTR